MIETVEVTVRSPDGLVEVAVTERVPVALWPVLLAGASTAPMAVRPMAMPADFGRRFAPFTMHTSTPLRSGSAVVPRVL